MAMTLDVDVGATVGSGDVAADEHAARITTKQIGIVRAWPGGYVLALENPSVQRPPSDESA
jgi:hypothetical protein